MKRIITKLCSFCLMLVLLFTTVMPSQAMAQDRIDFPVSREEMFLLSMLANATGDGCPGTDTMLTNRLDESVRSVLDGGEYAIASLAGWQLVWGPVAMTAPGANQEGCSTIEKEEQNSYGYPANSMYVVQKDNHYLVAVAGTSPGSIYDWFALNFDVGELVNWHDGIETDGKISRGADRGLNNLLELKDNDTSLLDFLQAAVGQNSNIDITFAGHSLGGALSPILALNIHEQLGSTPIFVYPSAGPTPGNDDFANYYNSQLEATTERFWNDLDVVPHAWYINDLADIPNLYEPLYPSEIITSLINGCGDGLNWCNVIINALPKDFPTGEGIISRVEDKNYTQMGTPEVSNGIVKPIELGSPVGSECNITLPTVLTDKGMSQLAELLEIDQQESINCDEPSNNLENAFCELEDFLWQVGYQHTDAYAVALGVTDDYCEMHYATGLMEISPERELAGLKTLILKASDIE